MIMLILSMLIINVCCFFALSNISIIIPLSFCYVSSFSLLRYILNVCVLLVCFLFLLSLSLYI